VVAEISKTANSFSTNFGLLAPGSTVLFCVYVVLTTGNEKGSEKFSVTHPA